MPFDLYDCLADPRFVPRPPQLVDRHLSAQLKAGLEMSARVAGNFDEPATIGILDQRLYGLGAGKTANLHVVPVGALPGEQIDCAERQSTGLSACFGPDGVFVERVEGALETRRGTAGPLDRITPKPQARDTRLRDKAASTGRRDADVIG